MYCLINREVFPMRHVEIGIFLLDCYIFFCLLSAQFIVHMDFE